jgi:hypothetical protein
MAEVLAVLGGGAAATQLLHYGSIIVSRTSALSRQIRHASDSIQLWVNESTVMLTMLDSFLSSCSALDPTTMRMVQRCRSDVVEIRSLLRPFRSRSQPRRTSRRQEVLFVLRREDEIERRFSIIRNNFQTMVLALLM